MDAQTRSMVVDPMSGILREQQYQWIRACVLSSFPFCVLLCIFWGIMGFMIPPIDGSMPAADLARHFLDHGLRLRVGFAVGAATCGLLMVWSIGIFCVMRRIEDRRYGVMSYLQLMGGGLTTLFPLFACLFWLAAAYRPEADPLRVQMFYDMGWLTMDVGFSVSSIQYFAIAILFLNDHRPVKLVPKWVSWLGIWCGLEFFVEIIMPNFRTGPFSWSGLFSYWLAFFVPFTWMIILSIYLAKAVTRLKQEDLAAAA